MSTYIIDFKDLSFGEHTFNFTVDGELFAGYEGCEVLGGSCNVDVNLQKSESMLVLEVAIEGEVQVECDRCLEPCSVEVDYVAPLLVKFSDSDELKDEYDGEVMWLPTATRSVDLAHYIYESIILSLPYQRVHDEGECNAEMLEKFRIVSGEEFEQIEGEIEQAIEEADNETMPAEELEKLAALKAKMLQEK